MHVNKLEVNKVEEVPCVENKSINQIYTTLQLCIIYKEIIDFF